VIDLDLIFKLILAALIGGAVGWQRERIHVPAGLRTHMLVSLSAALLTVTALIHYTPDVGRITAGIVTGMGFLGAGTIFRDKNHVHGLTTAASMWTVAAIGIAVGVGYIQAAIISAILVVIILQLSKFEVSKPSKLAHNTKK